MSESLQILGVHPMEADEPCHLVEIMVIGSLGFDPGEFVQELDDEDDDAWPSAWGECVLDVAGESVQADAEDLATDRAELLLGEVRMAFFIHNLDLTAPLLTPFGEVALPPATPLPPRLQAVPYEAP